jgi:trigger factor
MKTVVEDLGGAQKKLVFEVPPEEVKEELEKYCRKIAKEVDVRGFRKGKAPPSVIKRLFKQQILGEVASKIVSSSLEEALKEHSLTPLGEPDIDTQPLEEGKSFPFTITLDVKPEIDVRDYQGIQPDTEPPAVKEEEVEQSLKELQKVHAQVKDVEENREVIVSDVVMVDYEGLLNGETLPEDQKKDVFIEIGAGNYKREVEEALVGSRIGETREVEVEYPDSYIQKQVAGKKVVYRFHVKKIMTKEMPGLDDEFAKDVGAFESLDALKERLREQILREKQVRIRREVQEKILETILERNPMEAPRSLVKERLGQMMTDAQTHFLSRGMKLEQNSEDSQKLETELEVLAEKDVKKHLLLDAIARKESISVSDADAEEEIRKYAEQNQQSVEKIRADIRKQEDGMERFKHNLLREKTLAFLLPPDTIEEGKKTNEG